MPFALFCNLILCLFLCIIPSEVMCSLKFFKKDQVSAALAPLLTFDPGSLESCHVNFRIRLHVSQNPVSVPLFTWKGRGQHFYFFLKVVLLSSNEILNPCRELVHLETMPVTISTHRKLTLLYPKRNSSRLHISSIAKVDGCGLGMLPFTQKNPLTAK